MDSKTIRDKALKGLSAKYDDEYIQPVQCWDIDEEEIKDVKEYIFNDPELGKKYFTNLNGDELMGYFFGDDDDGFALPDNIKENYDLWLYATIRYPIYIDAVPNHFLDANFFINVLEACFCDGPYGDELKVVMMTLGDTNLCSDIHFIKKLISIHYSDKDAVAELEELVDGEGATIDFIKRLISMGARGPAAGSGESSIPFWLFNYCSPELLKDKTNLQEFISILSDEIRFVPDYFMCESRENYHWTVAINPDPRYFKAKIILSGLRKDPDIQNSLNKLKSAIEENFQMVEDQGHGIWLPREEGHQPIDWINTMEFLCE